MLFRIKQIVFDSNDIIENRPWSSTAEQNILDLHVIFKQLECYSRISKH